MDNGSEREVVRRMLGGDERNLDEFFADYFPGCSASPIATVRNLGSWRGEATLFTWLCAICRREISAWEKRTSRRVTVSLAEDAPGLRAALESKEAR